MAVVEIKITNRLASVDAGVELVCNNPTDTINFAFDDEWSAYEIKSARFSWANDYIDVVFTGDTVQIPEIHNTQYVFVGVYSEGIASTPVKVQCKRSILSYGDYEQIPSDHTYFDEFKATLDALNKAAEDTNYAAQRAETATNAANTATSNAQGATNAANAGATLANAAADSANTAAETINDKAPVIICESTNDVMSVSDASDMPLQGLRVFGRTDQVKTTGKNLLDVSKLAYGDSIVVNGDTITVKPLSTGQAVVPGCTLGEALNANVGDTVTISGETTGTNRLYIVDTATSWLWGTSLTLTAAMLASDFYLYGGATNGTSATITNLQIELGTAATQYEPYSGGVASPSPDWPQELVSVGNRGNIGLHVCGKNLLEVISKSETVDGVTFTVNADKSITANGTASATVFYIVKNNVPIVAGQTYTLSGCPSNGSLSTFMMYAHNNTSGVDYYDKGSGVTFTPKEGTYNVVIVVYKNTSINAVFKPMLTIGNVSDEYEPYMAAQSLTLSTPNGLPGIPVSSGGDYTDADGQQWICDEIDLERGVYVQRVKQISGADYTWQSPTEYEGALTSENGMIAIRIHKDRIQDIYNSVINIVLCSHLPNDGRWNYAKKAVCLVDGVHITVHYSDIGLSAWTNDSNTILAQFSQSELIKNIKFLVALTTPIETALSATEIAAYRALHSNYPNTGVYNDADAVQSVKYAADTKIYIDNKFAELAAALVANKE